MVRVAINGFGRIGRQVLEVAFAQKGLEIVAINDLTDTRTLAHLLKYDTVFGISRLSIAYDDNHLIINKKPIRVYSERDPSKLPWGELKVDLVVESTGAFTKREGAKLHLEAGAKKVFISAPAKEPDITIVKGVNEHLYDPQRHHIISNASCTTNGLAPMVKVLNDNLSIKRGTMVTAHAYTATQRLVDGPHKDLRRARAAAENIIPTSTGAAKSIGVVIPELDGKLDGFAWRVPVICGSILNLVVEVEKETDVEKVNWLFKQVSEHHMKGVLGYCEEPIVSSDIIKNPHSCIFDAMSTRVIGGTLVSVCGWYDNEWGFSNRMVDMIPILAR